VYTGIYKQNQATAFDYAHDLGGIRVTKGKKTRYLKANGGSGAGGQSGMTGANSGGEESNF